MNINNILNMVKMIAPNQVNKIQEAIKQAQNVMNNVNNPAEALKKAGVSKGFIDNLKKNTSSPIGKKVIESLGLDVEQANTILNNINLDNNNQEPLQSVNENNDIDILKKGLKKIKKK